MKKIVKGLMVGMLAFSISQAYAIQVHVETNAKDASAVGFQVEGKRHGGLGKSYTGTNMPAGNYSFGLKMNGKEVPCKAKGKKMVRLDEDTNVMLNVKKSRCSVHMQ